MATDALGRNLITDPDQIQSGRYAIVNVELTTQDVTVVPQMNGRQGEDNMRPVYFWAKDGDESLDITNLRITIKGKDAKGVIKTACTVTDVISETGGKFKMDIPGIFYQAPGPYEECWMEFATPDGQVVSTVNLYMVVIENNLIVTAGADKMYIDSIQKVIDEAMSRIKPLQDELDALQALEDAKADEIKALEDEIAALQKQIKDALIPTLNGDNTFTGKNTFTKDVTVQGDIITPNGDLNTLLKCYKDSAFSNQNLDYSRWHPAEGVKTFYSPQITLFPNFASDGQHGFCVINLGIYYESKQYDQPANTQRIVGHIDGLPNRIGFSVLVPNYATLDEEDGVYFAHVNISTGVNLQGGSVGGNPAPVPIDAKQGDIVISTLSHPFWSNKAINICSIYAY